MVHLYPQLLWIWVSVTHVPKIFAQDPKITPSNETDFVSLDQRIVFITTLAQKRYNIDALTSGAHLTTADQQVRPFRKWITLL